MILVKKYKKLIFKLVENTDCCGLNTSITCLANLEILEKYETICRRNIKEAYV